MASRVKTKVWIKATRTPISIIGTGTTSGTNAMKIINTISWPHMLPKRRKVRESGRAIWPIISMIKINGASHQIGPMKCLR